MDPDEALALLRSWAGDGVDNEGNSQRWLEHGPEVFRGLDEWLSREGFLPLDWAR